MSANGDRRGGNGNGEDVRARVETALRSIKATVTLATAIEEGAARLSSAGNDQATFAEEVRASVESMAAGPASR